MDVNNLAKTMTKDKRVMLVANVVATIVGLYAAYLSWSCNKGTNVFLRIVYAVFAFLFGLIYLLYYFFFRGECSLLLPLQQKV